MFSDVSKQTNQGIIMIQSIDTRWCYARAPKAETIPYLNISPQMNDRLSQPVIDLADQLEKNNNQDILAID